MANLKNTREVTMHGLTSWYARFRNIAIPISIFGIGLIALSGNAQSSKSTANHKELNKTKQPLGKKSKEAEVDEDKRDIWLQIRTNN